MIRNNIMLAMLRVRGLLLLLNVVHVTLCLSNIPADRVATVNSSTLFECSSDQPVVWSFRRTGQLDQKRIYVEGQPSDPRFSVNRSADDWYGLVISDVQLSDAGQYTCIDNNGFGPKASARLVVFDSLPACGTNISRANQPVVESQTINLRCTVIYAGSPPPRVRWTSPGTGTVNSSITSTNQSLGELTAVQLESWIVVTATARTVGPYRYTVSTFNGNDDDGTESTATPTYVWNSSSFVVVYAVRDVIINVTHNTSVVVGETLRCLADGFPPAQYEWRNVANAGRVLGTASDLQLDTDGQHTYECTATNVLANVTHSARARVSIVVNQPPTDETTTVGGLVTRAVVIATLTTAVIIICGVLLVHRLCIISRRRQRHSEQVASSSSAVIVTRQQVRVSPPPSVAAAAFDDGRKCSTASCLYDSIDDQDIGYEQLPGGRPSTVQQSVVAARPESSRQRQPSYCEDVDAVRQGPCRTAAENDYLFICDESDAETDQVGNRLQGASSVSVRYVQHQQRPQLQRDEQYVNHAVLPVPVSPGSAQGSIGDVGVYICTLYDD